MAQIGLLIVELHFPMCHSLKEKRMILKSLKDRLHNRYNVAISEEDYSDLWQRSRLGLVSIGPDKQVLMNMFERISEFIEQNGSIQLIGRETEYF